MGRKYSEAQVTAAMHSAVQAAMTGQNIGNAASGSDQQVRSRMAAMLSGGYDFADTLHNIYLDYGYPATLTFYNFWNMYRRFGPARRVVQLYPDQTWLDDPIVTSENAQFMRDLEALVGTTESGQVVGASFGLWRRMKGLDTRQRVGRYAGMYVRVKDNKKPNEPLEGTLPGINALADMVPLYESQLKVLTTQDDPSADDFGLPTMYQFSTGTAGNRNEKVGASFEIHPSRVIIAAEGSDNGSIIGVPCLEAVYNDLMDLRKINGGGGEGFYKNSSQNIVFDLKDGATAAANKAVLDDFNENYDNFAQNRQRRAMWTPGMEAKVLQSTLTNPKDFALNSWYAISAGSDIPVSLLMGNQTGRLAGDQDARGFLGEVQARRTDFGTDLVVAVLDWLIKYGVLPSAPYAVEWPDAQAPSKEQKLDNAAKMADINQKVFQSGGDVPFSGEEIRGEAGHDPDEIEETDDDGDELEEGTGDE